MALTFDHDQNQTAASQTHKGFGRQLFETKICPDPDIMDIVHAFLRIDDAKLRQAAIAAVRALASSRD